MDVVSKPNNLFTPFPKFEGKLKSVPLFLEQISCYKVDRFFEGVND